MFGVQPREFIDYNSNKDVSEEISLYERSKEIKKLIETSRSETLKNIEKAQEYQKKVQNTRTNPTDTVLEKGSRVMIRNEGLTGKLEPKFQGKYIVVGQASGGNYILKTANGIKLKKNYPITKLKPVLEDIDSEKETVEVEAILDKRKNPKNDNIEYLVKWKGFDSEENEWLPVDDFDDLQFVNEFNEKIHRDLNVDITSPIIKEKRRGRPRKTNIATGLSILHIIFILFIRVSASTKPQTKFDSRSNPNLIKSSKFISNQTIGRTNAKYINEPFTFCDKDKIKFLDLNENCKKPKIDKSSDKYKELDTWLIQDEVGAYQTPFAFAPQLLHHMIEETGLTKYHPVIRTCKTIRRSIRMGI